MSFIKWRSVSDYNEQSLLADAIQRCQARSGQVQRHHIGLAIQAWLDKHRRRLTETISFYRQDWNIIVLKMLDDLQLSL